MSQAARCLASEERKKLTGSAPEEPLELCQQLCFRAIDWSGLPTS
jgi:hypothetical protein